MTILFTQLPWILLRPNSNRLSQQDQRLRQRSPDESEIAASPAGLDRRRSLDHPMRWHRVPMTNTKPNYEVAKANLAAQRPPWSKQKQRWRKPRPASPVRRSIQLLYHQVAGQGCNYDRRVNIGQTVVSSLSAPSLFLIAKDLKRIQVWVSVNEADIGNIFKDQPVTFTVDALPNQYSRASR